MDKNCFENRYNKEICLLRDLEGVNFNSALDNLYEQYKTLDCDTNKFNDLLKEWELT